MSKRYAVLSFLATASLSSLTLGCLSEAAPTGTHEGAPTGAPDGRTSPGARPNGEPVVMATAPAGGGSDQEVGQIELGLCSGRSDLAPSFPNPIIGEGPWGTWEQCFHYCPAGSYAYGIRLKSEPMRGSGDDTALNGIKITCWNPTTGAYAGEVTAQEGPWGDYMALAECAAWQEPLAGGRMKIEASLGSGDDTSANKIDGWCHDVHLSSGPLISPPTHTAWGSWGQIRSCPIGSAVCGVRTKIEGSQGSGDDTSLNGIQFSCCNFPIP